jgi:hypothetical protein
VASDWNTAVERLLAADLTAEEHQLGLALVRETIGYRVRARAVGQQKLRDLARLHGRSFDRARKGLVAKRVVRVTPGRGGRGNRDSYEILLDEQIPAGERAFEEEAATPAEQRTNPSEAPAETSATIPAAVRARREKRVETTLTTLSKDETKRTTDGADSARGFHGELDPIFAEVLGREVVQEVLRQRLSPEVQQAVLIGKLRTAQASPKHSSTDSR